MKGPNVFELQSGKYVVCAKAGDPVAAPARARLIWAANTADATTALGLPTVLVGGAHDQGFNITNVAGYAAARRRMEFLYAVDQEFELRFLTPRKDDEERLLSDYAAQILPYAALVHTRDPKVASLCGTANVPFVIEFHDEDYQSPSHWRGLDFDGASCRAVVAITHAVADSLRERGVPSHKIIVLDSGTNARAAQGRDGEAAVLRRALLERTYSGLAVYAGGLQTERGVEHIMWAAQRMPHVRFVLAGGHVTDVRRITELCQARDILNIKLTGYVSFEESCALQQAADVLLFTRSASSRLEITSPLKYFEYLLSGRPIVAADVPSVRDCDAAAVATQYYVPGSVTSLVEAIERSIARHRWEDGRIDAHISLGLNHIWEERQRRLLNFVGDLNPRTTF